MHLGSCSQFACIFSYAVKIPSLQNTAMAASMSLELVMYMEKPRQKQRKALPAGLGIGLPRHLTPVSRLVLLIFLPFYTTSLSAALLSSVDMTSLLVLKTLLASVRTFSSDSVSSCTSMQIRTSLQIEPQRLFPELVFSAPAVRQTRGAAPKGALNGKDQIPPAGLPPKNQWRILCIDPLAENQKWT